MMCRTQTVVLHSRIDNDDPTFASDKILSLLYKKKKKKKKKRKRKRKRKMRIIIMNKLDDVEWNSQFNFNFIPFFLFCRLYEPTKKNRKFIHCLILSIMTMCSNVTMTTTTTTIDLTSNEKNDVSNVINFLLLLKVVSF